jgi:hypothetical protein
LPAQRTAFPPRVLSDSDVATIESGFEAASVVYAQPDLRDGGRKIDLTASEGPIAFQVTASRTDE